MTVALAIISKSFIVGAEDSALRRDVVTAEGSRVERDCVKKHHRFRRTFVSAWGELTGNRLSETLQGLDDETRDDPNRLAKFLLSYLRGDFRPKQRGHGHLGFHVGGLNAGNQPMLFNVSWEPPGTLRTTPRNGRYGFYPHTPSAGTAFLFNGRHDIAEQPIRTLIREVRRKREARFVYSEPFGAVCFADFVIRFAAEITPDVEPPIQLTGFTTKGSSVSFVHERLRPLTKKDQKWIRHQLIAG